MGSDKSQQEGGRVIGNGSAPIAEQVLIVGLADS